MGQSSCDKCIQGEWDGLCTDLQEFISPIRTDTLFRELEDDDHHHRLIPLSKFLINIFNHILV